MEVNQLKEAAGRRIARVMHPMLSWQGAVAETLKEADRYKVDPAKVPQSRPAYKLQICPAEGASRHLDE